MKKVSSLVFSVVWNSGIRVALSVLILAGTCLFACAQEGVQWVTYEGNGDNKGKHVVFVSGDEEYRSEEALPMLARIMAEHHGFTCTVLFPINPKTGQIDPEHQTNIPGLHLLEKADLMVLMVRFRELPDEQMKYFDAYTRSGKGVVALRTSTHAFRYSRDLKSPYAKYTFNSKVSGWEDGYGRQVLGETWVAHHGHHGKEGTRGIVNAMMESHPTLRGVRDVWGPTDVYTVRNITGDAQVLMYGQNTAGMTPDAPLALDKPAMPVAWVKSYKSESGTTSRVFTTTMGSGVDFLSEDLRRLLVNACYWSMGLEDAIPEKSNVNIIGEYNPTMFGFGTHKKGLTPAHYSVKK